MSGLIQSGGFLTGAACGLLSALPAGTYFTLGGHDYQKVTVEGHSPAAGKVWAHRLLDGRIVQLDDSSRADSQAVGSWAFTAVADVMVNPAEPAADTLGAVAIGSLLDTSQAPSTAGAPGRKVEVLDANGDAVSAGASASWLLLFTGSQVASEPDSTPVESWGGAGATAYKVQ